jgi:hypothetical protein
MPVAAMPPGLRAAARVDPLTYTVSLLEGIWRGDAWVRALRQHCGAGGGVRDLHGTLGEGVSLGVAEITTPDFLAVGR